MSPRATPAGLDSFLENARWFAGKGTTYAVIGIDVLSVLREDPLVELWRLRVEHGGTEHDYQLAVEARESPDERLTHVLVGELDGTWYYDALHDRDATQLWLELLDGSRRVDGVAAHRIGVRELPLGTPGRVLTAEQSNTSLVFGSALILKVFRRAQPGVNPDVEMHAALEAADCPYVAAPFGWLETGAGVLAFAQEFLGGGAEGWELAISSVRDLLREGDLYAEEVGGDFASEAHRLGAATAEVHAALRATLATEQWGAAEIAGRARRFLERLEEAQEAAPVLGAYADAVAALYHSLAAQPVEVTAQRVHGDLHLGQTMRVSTGWKILDFEGEPSTPVEERRALDSPLRDVAGMLRSFDYAARYALGDETPDSQASYRASEWAERNRAAFCEGYAHAAGADPRDQDRLLRAYEADKVIYEVVYESRMRPHWVSIPLSALDRLAGNP
ncbi:MAG TPA: hypothetical protein VMI11_03215 [Actinomycetes bacterium]|nr:hypothetical protein [Actinomycetes bacterium]